MDLYFITSENKVATWWNNIRTEMSNSEIAQEFSKFNCKTVFLPGRFSTVESALMFAHEEDATAFILKWG